MKRNATSQWTAFVGWTTKKIFPVVVALHEAGLKFVEDMKLGYSDEYSVSHVFDNEPEAENWAELVAHVLLSQCREHIESLKFSVCED